LTDFVHLSARYSLNVFDAFYLFNRKLFVFLGFNFLTSMTDGLKQTRGQTQRQIYKNSYEDTATW